MRRFLLLSLVIIAFFSCDKKETEVTAPKGHSYTDTVVAPTCTEDGYTRHECACGHYYDDTPVSALGHSWSDWVEVTPATCTENGTKKKTCVNCGEDETAEIAASGHSYVDTVTPPTCTEDGYTTHVCSVCGDTYKDGETDALGHKWDLWVTDDFTHAKKCSVCQTVDTSAQHTYTDSTCSVCSYSCGHSVTEVKDAFDAGVMPRCHLEDITRADLYGFGLYGQYVLHGVQRAYRSRYDDI